MFHRLVVEVGPAVRTVEPGGGEIRHLTDVLTSSGVLHRGRPPESRQRPWGTSAEDRPRDGSAGLEGRTTWLRFMEGTERRL